MDLEVISTTDGDVAVLSLAGELDMATRPGLVTALDALRDAGHEHVVVDLARLEFMDSTGIGLLVGHAVAARERGGSLRVINASGMPLRALQVTGVLDLLGDPDPAPEPDPV